MGSVVVLINLNFVLHSRQEVNDLGVFALAHVTQQIAHTIDEAESCLAVRLPLHVARIWLRY